MVLGKAKRIFQKYSAMKKTNDKMPNLSFFCFLYGRLKYDVSIEEFFGSRLYESKVKRREFYKTTNAYKRTWQFACKTQNEAHGLIWNSIYFLDYVIAKLYCPGLDATDYFRYEFYNIRMRKRRTFITEGGLKRLDSRFNGKGDKSLLSDKAKFNQYFSSFVNRKWISSIGTSEEKLIAFCETLPRVIAKPLEGVQGRGIFIADTSTRELILDICKRINEVPYILEEVVIQHPSIAKLNPASVNTIRVYSVLKDGVVHITGAVLRIGNGKKPTDNYSAGGMAATIDPDSGIVISTAINKENQRFIKHPFTNETILGFQVPCWDKVLDTVKKAHIVISDLRYIAWDVTVTSTEEVTFLEGNTHGGVSLQQHPMMTGKKDLYMKLL